MRINRVRLNLQPSCHFEPMFRTPCWPLPQRGTNKCARSSWRAVTSDTSVALGECRLGVCPLCLHLLILLPPSSLCGLSFCPPGAHFTWRGFYLSASWVNGEQKTPFNPQTPDKKFLKSALIITCSALDAKTTRSKCEYSHLLFFFFFPPEERKMDPVENIKIHSLFFFFFNFWGKLCVSFAPAAHHRGISVAI